MRKRRAVTVIGPLEAEVLSAMRKLKEGTPMQVHEELKRLNPNVTYTTVLTALSRLYTRGFLERNEVGRITVYRYVPSIERVRQIVQCLISTLYTAFGDEVITVINESIERAKNGEYLCERLQESPRR